MEVHIESNAAVSSLHSGDSACVGVGNAWDVENGFCSFAERTVELVREGTHELRREDAVIVEQRTQAPGQALPVLMLLPWAHLGPMAANLLHGSVNRMRLSRSPWQTERLRTGLHVARATALPSCWLGIVEMPRRSENTIWDGLSG